MNNAENTAGNHAITHYDLLPDHDLNTWKLTAEGGRTVFGEEPAKDRAVRCAAQIVSANFGRLNVHREDGTIEETRSYPRPPDARQM